MGPRTNDFTYKCNTHTLEYTGVQIIGEKTLYMNDSTGNHFLTEKGSMNIVASSRFEGELRRIATGSDVVYTDCN